MAKNKEGKRKRKPGFKGIIIAMIVAILSLLGFGWNGVDWGEGNIGDQDQSGQVESEMESDSQSETESPGEEEKEDEETASLALYVYEDKLYTDQALSEEISLVEVEVLLEAYEGQEVFLYDAGAVKQTYEEVEKIIDVYVDSKGLIKVKSVID
jgi:hypothetical protein